MILAPAILVTGLALAPVELRGAGARVIDAPIVSVTIRGVEVAGDTPRLIGWEEIRRVTGEHAEAAEQFAEIADKAWRARTRLARGDAVLAEPLLEELFIVYRGVDSPTALLVADGLLRARLRAGAQAGAVAPLLESLRLRRAGRTHPADAAESDIDTTGDEDASGPTPGAGRVIDPRWSLAPALPPIWLDSPPVFALAESSPVDADAADPIVAAIGALYRHAARFEAGLASEPPVIAGEAAEAPGVRFVEQIVMARAGDAAARSRAREALLAGMERDLGTWREAWRRAGVGRSLLMEPDPALRRQGVIQLLHLPARIDESSPYLVGVALAESAAELKRQGDAAGASSLLRELEVHHPHHPALQWLARQAAIAPLDSNRSGLPNG